ncbi:MAG: glycosyltransferase [Chthoniobacterales bacterium]
MAFLCATYLKPEMHHVHRQIVASEAFDPMVVTQKVENREKFPFEPIHLVRRTAFRFFGREVERRVTGRPWQVTGREADAVLNILREREVGVLHVFFGNVAVHWLSLLRRLEVPFVVSFHGSDVAGAIASEGYREAREEVFERARWVVARSEALAERVGGMGCPEEKLRVLRTVVPDFEFGVRQVPKDGVVRLVQASRLVPKKGVGTSLRAFRRLLREWPKAELVIAGTGPLEKKLKALAEELDVAGQVRWVGFVEQTELAELLRSAHVFLHPSEGVDGDVEGVPNSMLEAMASGLPVAATRHGGIAEVIRDGVNGMLSREGDHEELGEQVSKLLSDRVLYLRVAREGAATVRREFSASGMVARLAEIYAA